MDRPCTVSKKSQITSESSQVFQVPIMDNVELTEICTFHFIVPKHHNTSVCYLIQPSLDLTSIHQNQKHLDGLSVPSHQLRVLILKHQVPFRRVPVRALPAFDLGGPDGRCRVRERHAPDLRETDPKKVRKRGSHRIVFDVQ